MNIVKVGATIKQGDETILIVEGDLPPDCVVVFMDKKSFEELQPIIKEGRYR